jgi:uncharacterized protein (TIGR02118 family)
MHPVGWQYWLSRSFNDTFGAEDPADEILGIPSSERRAFPDAPVPGPTGLASFLPRCIYKSSPEMHGPMTSKLPGLKGYKYGPARALDGGPSEFFWYWCGTFDSTQAALDAVASPEGQAGAADVPNYYHDVPLFMVVEK